MRSFKFNLITLMLGTLLSFISFAVQADDLVTTTTVERHVVTTPAPKPVCASVPGHWEGNVWVDIHNVCRYTDRTEGAAWVESYWSCTDADANGTCTAWVLVPGHWVKTLQ